MRSASATVGTATSTGRTPGELVHRGGEQRPGGVGHGHDVGPAGRHRDDGVVGGEQARQRRERGIGHHDTLTHPRDLGHIPDGAIRAASTAVRSRSVRSGWCACAQVTSRPLAGGGRSGCPAAQELSACMRSSIAVVLCPSIIGARSTRPPQDRTSGAPTMSAST